MNFCEVFLCLTIFLLTIFTALQHEHHSQHHHRVRRGQYTDLMRNSKQKTSGTRIANSEQREKMIELCSRADCTHQSAESNASRTAEVDRLMHRLMALQFDGNEAAAREYAEEQVAAVQKAKVALLKAEGLDDIITPKDDGLWDDDVILTKEQAVQIVAAYEKETEGGGSRRRAKRSVYFMEGFPAYKWKLPVPYRIEDQTPEKYKFTTEERQKVKDAIKDIESKTCIRFVESSANDALVYYKFDRPGLCGNSYTGYNSMLNEINLRANCGKDFMGVAIHETMHALGIGHTHRRVDRGDYLEMHNENMDPRDITKTTKYNKDLFTTYGIPYDYHSIMHYEATAYSNNEQPTMIPKRRPIDYFQSVMGRRTGGLSSRDAELLRKMYCQPECKDHHVWCGWWRYKGYCKEENGFFNIMRSSCQKSCDFC